MITEEAEVIAVEGDHAWVEALRRTACGSCTASKGCGTGIVARFFTGRKMRIRVDNEIAAVVGDRVLVAIADEVLVRGSLMAYMFPLLSLFAGALLGDILQPLFADPEGEGLVIFLGFTGLLIGCLCLRRFSHILAKDDRYNARIVERLSAVSPISWTLPGK